MIEPGSKLDTWNNKDNYFFRTDFSDDVYCAIATSGICDLFVAFYNVTNYYFEDELRREGASSTVPIPSYRWGCSRTPTGFRPPIATSQVTPRAAPPWPPYSPTLSVTTSPRGSWP